MALFIGPLHAVEFLWCHADAGVLDGDDHVIFPRARGDADVPFVGELDRVAHQVEQDLVEPVRVGLDRGEVFGEIGFQPDGSRADQGKAGSHHRVQDGRERYRLPADG